MIFMCDVDGVRRLVVNVPCVSNEQIVVIQYVVLLILFLKFKNFVISINYEQIVCDCGAVFCYRCADAEIGDHTPATCVDIEKWYCHDSIMSYVIETIIINNNNKSILNRLAKASDESENLTWLAANTKKCPKCRSPIEKNGGWYETEIVF